MNLFNGGKNSFIDLLVFCGLLWLCLEFWAFLRKLIHGSVNSDDTSEKTPPIKSARRNRSDDYVIHETTNRGRKTYSIRGDLEADDLDEDELKRILEENMDQIDIDDEEYL